MTARSERRVHARNPATRSGACEIVRYDVAGVWYAEYADGTRDRLTLRQVVNIVESWLTEGDRQGEVLLGVPGGRSFDSALRRRGLP